MLTPTQDGRYKGDTFYGDEADATAPTHEWNGSYWSPLGPPAPLHMRAIDRDRAPGSVPLPANMTAEADAHQAIPGVEAIPADMPDAPRDDLPLEYNLQNFNALVAANTAMETEIGSLNEKMDLIAQQRDSFKEGLDLARGDITTYLTQIKDLQSADRDSRKRLDEKDVELQFARDERDTLQRRLDRSLGYLDRVLDDEDGIHAPQTRTVPAPRPPVGPALGEIPDAVRPDTARRAMSADWGGPGVRFDEPGTARRRRF